MEELISQIVAVALSPFTSQTDLVVIPCAFSFVLGCVMLLFALIRRRY